MRRVDGPRAWLRRVVDTERYFGEAVAGPCVDPEALLVAVLVGALQGLLEWLPISSEGNVAAVLAVFGVSPVAAVRYALFLHAGTAVAAAAYYRDDLRGLGRDVGEWDPESAFSSESAELSFLAVATVVSGVVAIAAYSILAAVVSAVAGGLFVALVGVLLVFTGIFQWLAIRRESGTDSTGGFRTDPGPVDAVLVGLLQGLAVLPGVSRSGTTVGALLIRGYPGATAFRLSFLLAIPASLGAGVLVLLDSGGLHPVDPGAAVVSVVVSGVVGFVAIGVLMRVVERVDFPAVCLGLGGLAIVGGLLVL